MNRCYSKSKMRAQLTMEFLVMLALFLIIAIISVGLYVVFTDFSSGMDAKNSLDYWKSQARPFSIDDAFYETYGGRIYFAIKSNSDHDLVLTKMMVNGTSLAFFKSELGTPEGASTPYCNLLSCTSGGCVCSMDINAYSSQTILSESYMIPSIVCPQDVKYTYFNIELEYSSLSTNVNYTQSGVYPLALKCLYRFNA